MGSSVDKSQPIKVLHLIPTLSSGGAERQLVNLVLNTSKATVEHIVCVINGADFFGPTIQEAGIRVIDLKIDGHRPFIKAATVFNRIVRAESPDVVHSWLYDANIISRLSALPFCRIPLITSWQLADYDPVGIAGAGWNPTKVFGLKAIDKATAMLTRPYFVACSDFVKESYRQHFRYAGSGVETIYNAVDPRAVQHNTADSSDLAESLNIPRDAFIFLNVARLDPQKNQKKLLDAFQKVIASVPTAYLLLVGSGGMKKELVSYAKDLCIDTRVMFLGQRKDVGDLLHYSDVFVFPSLFEGLPVALAEAMYKAKPCIVSRIGVFEEIMIDKVNGILIDPHSVPELYEAMVKLYQDESLRQGIGDRGYETAVSSFDAATTAKLWEELYSRVASK